MLRVRAIWSGVAGTPWYTNLYFDGTGSADAQAAADAVHVFLTGFSFQFSNQTGVAIDSFVAVVDPVSGDVTGGHTVDPGDSISGQETGQLLPKATQSLSTLNTPIYVAGRNIKGRCFLPGYTEAANDGSGVMISTYATGLQAEWATLVATGPDLVVWSRKNGLAAPVSNVTVSQKWAVLKSRRD